MCISNPASLKSDDEIFEHLIEAKSYRWKGSLFTWQHLKETEEQIFCEMKYSTGIILWLLYFLNPIKAGSASTVLETAYAVEQMTLTSKLSHQR